MVSRKYLVDYRLEETTGKNGRIKTTAVYIGGDFAFAQPVSRGEKWLLLSLSVLSWLAFVGALIPVTSAARITYVMLPFVLSALPMYLMTGAAASLLAANDVMTRESSDKISKRLPPGAITTTILSGVAVIAFLVSVIVSRDSVTAGDFVFGALSLLIAFMSAFVFYKSKKLKAVRIDSGEIITRDAC